MYLFYLFYCIKGAEWIKITIAFQKYFQPISMLHCQSLFSIKNRQSQKYQTRYAYVYALNKLIPIYVFV